MRLTSGSRLGHYEIVAPLGAGGMGEVYRARDPRLGREVALKILPGEFSGDTARRARFEQEARAAAALSHPNIVGLHDVGTEDGVSYFVGELVAGETLTDLIQRGPVPLRKLLDIAVQIADGMAAAHAARITHRDLKPANIMVTPEGRVKILDFGLAKQTSLPTSSPDETMTVQQTTPGMILGTVHYMSPEQARGAPADHRSDQFSFGLILYEMATGKKAFDRPETIQTMSAILTDAPSPIEISLPEPLLWAIDRCLAKDPADRYESTSDLYRDLRSIRDHLTSGSSIQQVAPKPVPLSTPRRASRWPLAVAATAALAVAFAAGSYFSKSKLPDQSNYRFIPFAFSPGGQGSPVWAPDGKSVAYGAAPENAPSGAFQIFIRYLDSPVPAQLTRLPEDALPLAWAPDGKHIVFRSSHKPAGLWTVSSVGGEPETFMPYTGRLLAVSPDLQSVAFIERGEDDLYSVWISSPPGSPRKRYLPDPIASKALFNDAHLRFSPDGKSLLLFVKNDKNHDEAWLMPFPPNVSKPPKLVMPGLHSFSGTPNFSWMPDGRHVILSFQPIPGVPSQLWMADTVSNERRAITSGTTSRSTSAVSPDGRKIVFLETTGNFDVVSVELEHATVRRLIATERSESMPAWAAKQPLLVYVSNRNGPQEIWLHGADGSERPIVTARDFPLDTTQWFMAPALSPTGDRVAYGRSDEQGRSQLWLSAVSGGSPVPLTNDAAAEMSGSWSPDGAWFTYVAVRNGKLELLKVKSTGQATPVLIKSGVQGEAPSWSPTGDLIQCGNQLISTDGVTVRDIGDHGTVNYVFSQDGKLLYGLRIEGDKQILFSLDVARGVEKAIGDIGRDYPPVNDLHPAIRFSLAPDGKSFVFSTGKFKSNLWLLEGWAP